MNKHTSNNIGELVNKISLPLYKSNGFSNASIILDWKKIVGIQFSNICLPIKMSKSQNGGNFLFISASKSVASQFVYYIPNILEKINTYFGYKAVDNIKFIDNAGVDFSGSNDSFEERKEDNLQEDVQFAEVDVNYAPLKTALQKLQRYIMYAPIS